MNLIRFALFATVLLNSQTTWISKVTAAEGTITERTIAKHVASEHSITVVATSIDDIQSLMDRLPKTMGGTLNSFARQVTGPISQAVNPREPVGLWFDWTDTLPAPVAFFKNPQLDKLQQAITRAGVKVNEVKPGIFELGLKVPLFYSTQHEFLFVATAAEHLTSLEQVRDLPTPQGNASLQVQIALNKIPVQVRTEIAEVLAQRLLPPAVTLADEDTAEHLLKLYVTRMLRKFANHGKTIVLDIESTGTGFQMLVDIEGSRLTRVSTQPSVFPKLSFLKTNQFISLHTDLTDEEVAMLNWWSRSFADQVMQSFDQAVIENRSGREALELGAKGIADLVSKTAQSGVLEGFACLVGPENDLPIVGLRVPQGKLLDQAFRQIARMGTIREMGVQAIELDLGTIGDAKVHRLTIGDPGEDSASIALVISDHCVYITEGISGLRTLRGFLEQTDQQKVSPQTFSLRFAGSGIAELIGFEDAAADKAQLEISSEYTKTGVKFKVDYSM